MISIIRRRLLEGALAVRPVGLLLLLLAQWGSGGGLPERTLAFDPAVSIGRVLVRPEGSAEPWRYFGEAWGGSRIPAGMEAGLEFKRDSRTTLAPLERFAPDDLQMVVVDGVRLDDSALAHLGGLTGLRVIRITNASLRGAPTEHLRAITRLQELDLSNNRLSWKAVPPLAEFPELRALSLANNALSGGNFAEFPRLERLERLDLSRTRLGDDGLSAVLQAKGLRELNLGHTRITGRSMKLLAAHTSLVALQLDGIKLTGEELAAFGPAPSIERLSLARTDLHDADLAPLAGWQALGELDLTGCRFLTDAAVATLRQMIRLRILKIDQTQITDPAVTKLEQALPECMIVSRMNSGRRSLENPPPTETPK